MRFISLLLLYLILFDIAQGQTNGVSNSLKEKYKDYEQKLNTYKSIITNSTVYQGFIAVIHKNNHIYLDIPKEIISRDLLFVSKCNNDVPSITANQPVMPKMVRLLVVNQQILLIVPDVKNIYPADDIIKIGIENTKKDNTLYAFDLIGHSRNIKSYLIDVTDFINKQLQAFKPKNGSIIDINNGNYLQNQTIEVFSKNIIIKSNILYTSSPLGVSSPLSVFHSIVLLKKKPIFTRVADDRVGYNAINKIHFTSNPPYKEELSYITRWDISLKNDLIEPFKRGEIVKPNKPIVVYIDTAFPDYMKTHIKKGIQEWQIAFEAAGFRDAIIAKNFPFDDVFSTDDVKNTCIIMAPKMKDMVKTSILVDPRSGEIIKGEIRLNPLILEKLKLQEMIQTSTVNKEARNISSNKGMSIKMLKYFVGHEVGHLLGLEDNLKASHAYNISDLRSPNYVSIHGISPSIMDVLRYNYIAQPKDGFETLSPPKVGAYDKFAISWGYKPIFNANGIFRERHTLDDWIIKKNKNPIYQYNKMDNDYNGDPSLQSFSLGNNVVDASKLGIKNLKIVIKNLHIWGVEDEHKTFKYLKDLYAEGVNQHYIYLKHILSSIGGRFSYDVVPSDYHSINYKIEGNEVQKEAVLLIVDEVLNADTWIISEQIRYLIGPQYEKWKKNQALIIRDLLSENRLIQFESNGQFESNEYTLTMYFEDLHHLLWEETIQKKEWRDFEISALIIYAETIHTLIHEYKRNKNEGSGISPHTAMLLYEIKEKILNTAKLVRSSSIGLSSQLQDIFEQ